MDYTLVAKSFRILRSNFTGDVSVMALLAWNLSAIPNTYSLLLQAVYSATTYLVLVL